MYSSKTIKGQNPVTQPATLNIFVNFYCDISVMYVSCSFYRLMKTMTIKMTEENAIISKCLICNKDLMHG